MNERGDRDSEQDTWSKIVETVRNTPKSILKSIRATIRASGGAKDADRLKTAGFGDKEQAASKVFGTDREITLPENPLDKGHTFYKSSTFLYPEKEHYEKYNMLQGYSNSSAFLDSQYQLSKQAISRQYKSRRMLMKSSDVQDSEYCQELLFTSQKI
ncbi:unnamed protein product [Acanthoscelides obtectus]|uniref:Uncharacterized protein n=1 Tax=Acanthoscelides obtectus TaxID=200917 RepID=A0A9P0K940_ACAOB|nr:unnamed protein product [Acanthoscelides obtectus]CAK1645379.1 hypothetical protein AOBTE_LOCUS14098 [Acanthoscelides obtectus]